MRKGTKYQKLLIAVFAVTSIGIVEPVYGESLQQVDGRGE